MDATFKLRYFPARGRAEVIRLLFAASGIRYEDERIPFADWPAIKEEIATGQLPSLEINGKQFSQTSAIAIYLATIFGLHGKSSADQLQVNQIFYTALDLKERMFTAAFEKDGCTQAQLLEQLNKELIPRCADVFEKMLAKLGSEYFLGKKISLADIVVYDTLEQAVEEKPDILNRRPNLKINMYRVSSNVKIKRWLEARPQTPF